MKVGVKISEFQGRWRFLSNFYPSAVEFEKVLYPSVEHAYQAAKCADVSDRARFLSGRSGEAKRLGKSVRLRSDWEKVKVAVMADLVRKKFACPQLRQQLLSTGVILLEEGNWWGDTFWGVCRGAGQNHLGKILMQIREELQNA